MGFDLKLNADWLGENNAVQLGKLMNSRKPLLIDIFWDFFPGQESLEKILTWRKNPFYFSFIFFSFLVDSVSH
jgi:hypothetical protein